MKDRQRPSRTENKAEDRIANPEAERENLPSIKSVFESYYSQYQLVLHKILTHAQRRFSEAQELFSRETYKAQMDGFLSTQEAYHNYLTEYQRAQMDPEGKSPSDVYKAYREYVRVYQEAQDTMQKVVTQAEQAQQRELEQVREEVRAAWEAAYWEYIRDLKGAWTDLDAQALDAGTLAAIGQSLIAAAASGLSGGQAKFPR